MIKKIVLSTFIFSLLALSVKAQDFLEPSFTYSHSKPAYLTLANGEVVECTINKISRKKGLIELIEIEKDGKKKEYKPEEITFMYLPPSGLDKVNKLSNIAGNAQKWDNPKIDNEKIKEGYIYLEQVKVSMKKGQQIMMMQLLNPHFSGRIKVYHDPFAKETASAGIGGVKLAGGLAKSYYVSKDGEVAYRLFKDQYKKAEFDKLTGDCKEVVGKYTSVKWSELGDHILLHQSCVK